MRRLLAAVCLVLAGTAGAGPVTFESPAERVAVLELFTSHGSGHSYQSSAVALVAVLFPGKARGA